MNSNNTYLIGAVVLSVLAVGAAVVFGGASNSQNTSVTSPAVAEAKEVVMYKSPSCACCTGWAEHIKKAGFTVDTKEAAAMMQVKTDNNIPRELESCHTAKVDGYVVEGHVPYEAVEKLLDEQPDVKGIGVAGMPAGSPGMGGVKQAPFEIYTITKNGERGELFMKI